MLYISFFYGIFGRMGNVLYNIENPLPKLKIPFSIHASEMVVPSVDTRISGFGLFFSGLLVLSLIGILCYVTNKQISKNYRIFVSIGLLLILIGSFAIPAGYWARYNPFLWLIILISLYIYEPTSKTKNLIYSGYIILLLINTLYFALCPIQYTYRSYFKNSNLASGTKIKTDLFLGRYPGVLFNLEDDGVEYEIVDTLENSDGYAYCILYAYDE